MTDLSALHAMCAWMAVLTLGCVYFPRCMMSFVRTNPAKAPAVGRPTGEGKNSPERMLIFGYEETSCRSLRVASQAGGQAIAHRSHPPPGRDRAEGEGQISRAVSCQAVRY